MGVRILILLALSSTANASDTLECLSKIAYAESRGTAVDGVVAVMHAALRHSKMIKRHVCLIPAQQKSLPLNLREVYSVLAKGVLGGSIPDLSVLSAKPRRSGRGCKDALDFTLCSVKLIIKHLPISVKIKHCYQRMLRLSQ